MRHLYILFLFFGLMLNAQNFKVENGTLQWQKTFTDSVPLNQMVSHLKKQGFTISQNTTVDFEKTITVENLLQHGKFSTMLSDGYYIGIVEFKENKYRVRVTQIHFKSYADPNNFHLLDYWTIKKGKIKNNNLTQTMLSTLDTYFTKTFTVTESTGW